MKLHLLLLLCMFSFTLFAQTPAPLYKSNAFTLYPDRVVQGKNEARVLTRIDLMSNYQSPASENFSRLISFKFSINQKDNEAAPGNDHWILIGNEHESPVLPFGGPTQPLPAMAPGFLPVNYEYTFQVDMNPVLTQFKEKGYYEAFDGSRVAAADFKGFYIAGGSEPLTWDFVNLESQGLKLTDPDGDGIHTLTVKLNPYDPESAKPKTWRLEKDLSNKPKYTSDQPIVDALFNLSLEEAIKNIEPDSTFRTGAKWGGVWTRDISYSILLAFAYHEPEVAKISLMKKVKHGRIIQDTGSGGAWPVSSDRTTWALAAWEIYKTTGDKAWLRQSFDIIQNTLEDDYLVIRDPVTGLYSGESSFLDWREQTYPKWMNNADIYQSQNLGTNAVHYRVHRIMAQMAEILGESGTRYNDRAEAIRKGINEQLWMSDSGYYAQYLYGRGSQMVSPRFEALGEALCVLFSVADNEQARSIFANSPVTPFGVTCIYPQIPGIPPYHNNGIWPFVQSFWNLAAARAGNERALNHGLAALYRAGALFLTNYENFVAETGDFMGTEINSDRMLWSMAGNLSMVHHLFMGMQFEANGIKFSPKVPSGYTGKKTLSNFRYRDAILTIDVIGTGNKIKSITLDGEPLPDAYFPGTSKGAHNIRIELDNQPWGSASINMVSNHFSLPTPQVTLNNNRLEWPAIEGAMGYMVYENSRLVGIIPNNGFTVSPSAYVEYQIVAGDKNLSPSFASEPIAVYGKNRVVLIDFENIATASSLPYTGFEGKGFVETNNDQNTDIEFSVVADKPGDFLIDMRYSNGSGPWNTDNKCALRSLYVNDKHVGAMVFPQRGTDEWSDWGWSNRRTVTLKAGLNKLHLKLEPWNTNMNVDVNRAMLDQVRVIKED